MHELRQQGTQTVEERWYRYDLRGRTDYVTRKVAGDEEPGTGEQYYRGTRLYYDARGHVWIAVSEQWKVQSGVPIDCTALTAMEYRYTSGRARYMVRALDPTTLLPVGGTAYEGGWHDYDGDDIYGDYTIAYDSQSQPPALVATDATAHEPGLAQYDHAAAALHHLHGNLIGSTERMTDAAGALANRKVYTAFGEVVYSDGVAGTRYGYAGAWGYQAPDANDPLAELGWLHVGERYYDPANGRFVQRDPIGIRGGQNTYAYVRGDPARSWDPIGLQAYTDETWSWKNFVKLVGAGVATGGAAGGPVGAAKGGGLAGLGYTVTYMIGCAYDIAHYRGEASAQDARNDKQRNDHPDVFPPPPPPQFVPPPPWYCADCKRWVYWPDTAHLHAR